MKRLGVPAVVVALLLVAGSASGAAPAGPNLLREPAAQVPQLALSAPFHAAPLLVSGTDAYRDGEYLYQDYLLDDHGADTVPGPGSSADWASQPLFSPAAGDVLYPTDPRFHGQAADLVELRIKPTKRAIVYRVTFATPSAPGTVVAGIGIDTTDGAGARQPVSWPSGAGVSSPGLRWFITAWGTGGAITRLPGGSTVRLPAGAVRWSEDRAQMTISVPRTTMDPGRSTWRYVAGTGLWSGSGWMTAQPGATALPERPVSGNPALSAPGVFNLAFRFHEPVEMKPGTRGPLYTTAPGAGNWFEDDQAYNLAHDQTGQDFADVSFAALARKADGFIHSPGRVQARIYGSRLPIPAGVNHASFPEFGGALQPYLVRVPPQYRPGHPAPVLFALHPSNSGYTVYNVNIPNWGPELGDERGSFVVTPLSRGLDGPDPNSGAFTGAAEADFFEVWADLARHFTLDRKRITVGGYSLGGYAAYALAETWPDLFADVFSVVGAPPSNGMNTQLLGNLRWEPVLAWNQADDSEVPYTDASAAERTLTALGLRHEAWTFPAGGHLGPALRDDWREAFAHLNAALLQRDPPRIVYGLYPALDAPRLGLVHDHAYWVSRLRVARGATMGSVDARSLAFGLGDPVAVQYSGTGSSGGESALIHGVRWGPLPRTRRRNALRLTLSGLRRIQIDGAGARLHGRRGLSVSISTDVRVSVRVMLRVCARPRLRVGGRTILFDRARRRSLSIVAAPGKSTVRISRCGPRR